MAVRAATVPLRCRKHVHAARGDWTATRPYGRLSLLPRLRATVHQRPATPWHTSNRPDTGCAHSHAARAPAGCPTHDRTSGRRRTRVMHPRKPRPDTDRWLARALAHV